jgi:hypothetical protein
LAFTTAEWLVTAPDHIHATEASEAKHESEDDTASAEATIVLTMPSIYLETPAGTATRG